ncbi:hypothetical protein [Streptomyces mesophilus]|uniref:hypothetical protein n=1 Tax=Streptomyces mesophilus TaxID=1775132 RepID=UPI00332C34B5
MRIKGYEGGPLTAGEPLLKRPGFWSTHLLGLCPRAPGAERPVPEWFGDDGADVDELQETLCDPERWPVFRVRAADGSGVVVVYRNLEGDEGIDFLATYPGRPHAQQFAQWEGERVGPGLPWTEIVRIADAPALDAAGARDPHARLLLLLPLLDEPHVPAEAPPRLTAALTATGTPPATAPHTARRLLAGLTSGPWHDPAWGPSWGGGQHLAGEAPSP